MNRILLLLIFYFPVSISLYGQNEVELLEFSPSECIMEPNLHLIQKRIVSQKITNGIFEIEVATLVNCGLGEVGEVKLIGDTLSLISTIRPADFEINSNGDTNQEEIVVVECDCCFHFKYTIAGISTIPKYISINKEIITQRDNRFVAPAYEKVNGDSLIINDSLGFIYTYAFYESGQLKSIRKSKGNYWESSIFYESGRIEKELKVFGDFDTIIETSYDEQGEILEQVNTVEKN